MGWAGGPAVPASCATRRWWRRRVPGDVAAVDRRATTAGEGEAGSSIGCAALDAIRGARDLPRYVSVAMADNELLLDLDSVVAAEFLAHEARGGGRSPDRRTDQAPWIDSSPVHRPGCTYERSRDPVRAEPGTDGEGPPPTGRDPWQFPRAAELCSGFRMAEREALLRSGHRRRHRARRPRSALATASSRRVSPTAGSSCGMATPPGTSGCGSTATPRR